MFKRLIHGVLAAIVGGLLAVAAHAGQLVTVEWLEKNRGDVLLIDNQFGHKYAAKHIPGAINVDVFSLGPYEAPTAEWDKRFAAWGVKPGTKVVLYDEGGTYLASTILWELYHRGFPPENLAVLDGGLARWEASGRAVTKDPTPPPGGGTFRVTTVREDVRSRLPEFLAATGDRTNHAIVEALEAPYHYGGAQFFDRAGHIPNATLLPSEDFFNADKTFKSPEEMRRMLAYLGVRPEQQVSTYCGGGISATLPWFAMKFMLEYPRVKVYRESQAEWLRDERSLPLWTYDAPQMKREMDWLQGWSNKMTRMYGVANLSVVDVRSAEAYGKGHVPFAVSIPADVFRSNLADPARLAETLGKSGVNPAHEAVIVSDGKLEPHSALAFLVLELLGQKKVSVLMGSIDDWGLRGHPIAKEPTIVGRAKSPQELAVAPATYNATPRTNIVIRDAASTKGHYPKVFIASGKAAPAKAPGEGRMIHVPYADLVSADGTPKAAKDIWNVLVKAGLPRYAEIIVFADDPGEAAVNYFVLKLLGYPDVKVLLASR